MAPPAGRMRAAIMSLHLLAPFGAMAQSQFTDPPEPTFNVRDYGAKGDGVTDDYPALRAAYEAVNAEGGGTLLFPPGTYLIDQYRTRDNGVALALTGCEGLLVEGYGAKIDIKGSFHRPADLSPVDSSHNSVIALQFINCRNFVVRGFELDGNVHEMTRDEGVVEGQSHGIVTNQCTDYTIEDIVVHHFAADGVYLGDSDTISDRNGHITRVTSRFNARDGVSLIAARGILIRDSYFENNGWQRGTYLPHNPSSGANVESKPFHDLDVKTGDITFEDCVIRDNRLSQVQATNTEKENVTFRRCIIDRGISDYVNTVSFAVLNGVIEDSILNVRQLVPSWEAHPGTITTLRNNVIRSDYRGITDYVNLPDRKVLIEGNQLIGTHASPTSDLMPLLRNTETIFRNNTVFIPKEAKTPGVTAQRIAVVTFVKESSGNTFYTDYVTGGNAHFYTDYTGTPPAAITMEQYPTERFFRRGPNAAYSASTQLAFVTQPGGALEGQAFSSQPVIEVRNSMGNRNTGHNGPVTLAIRSGTGADGAALLGTQTVQAVQGVATFTNLSISPSGEGYVLRATAGGLLRDSEAFNVAQPGFTLADAVVVLQIAGGFRALATGEMDVYNMAAEGTSAGRVDLQDASRVLRIATGLDAGS